MKTTHTPGPWQSQPTAGHDKHGQSAVYAESDSKDIAIVYDGAANAQLIAAAPDMLEALRAIESCLSPADCDRAANLVRDAIKKAEGR